MLQSNIIGGFPLAHQTCIFTTPQNKTKIENDTKSLRLESLLTSGNGLKEEKKTYLTFLSWIHIRAISTVEVSGKGFHIFKGALSHVSQ